MSFASERKRMDNDPIGFDRIFLGSEMAFAASIASK
jgi:hypothetical protein